MAVLSANRIIATYGDGPKEFIVKTGVTIYAGALVCFETSTGHIKPFVVGAGVRFIGIAVDKVVGDGALLCLVDTEGVTLKNATVTGLGAVTDIKAPVYASNDNELTLTRPDVDTDAIGYVWHWKVSTTGDVRLFSEKEIEVQEAGLSDQVLAGLTMVDGTDMVFGTTTGTKIGTATAQKLAFYGDTPVVQAAAPTTAETTITNAGTASDYAIQAMTNSTPYGFVTQAEAETLVEVVLNNQVRINEIATAIVALGLMA